MFDVTAPAGSLIGIDSKRVFGEQGVWARRSDEIIKPGKECRAEEIVSEIGRVFTAVTTSHFLSTAIVSITYGVMKTLPTENAATKEFALLLRRRKFC